MTENFKNIYNKLFLHFKPQLRKIYETIFCKKKNRDIFFISYISYLIKYNKQKLIYYIKLNVKLKSKKVKYLFLINREI